MILICPGVHEQQLTTCFLAGMVEAGMKQLLPAELLIFPTEQFPAYSAIDIFKFLEKNVQKADPVTFISFSAGVVGSIGVAWSWQQIGGTIKAFIALDGWGVPLGGNFPIYRVSHDRFTHWSSELFGGGTESFYADPPVDHLELWRSPHTTKGWWIHPTSTGLKTTTPTTAAFFILEILKR